MGNWSRIGRRGAVIGVLGALAVLLWLATRPPPLTIQGEVSADRVDVSPRSSGRVVQIGADVGDLVESGAVLVQLDSPQLRAALDVAQAALAVAQADLSRVDSTRPETIQARRAELAAAEADIVLNRETYNRQLQLARTGNTPQARVDEATRNLETAIRRRESAQAALRLATTGASAEERALAAAQVKQAEAAVNQRRVDVAELIIHAPISGQVTTRMAEIGENFSVGAPMIALVDMKHAWMTFNLREDLLHGLAVGDQFDVTIPAVGAGRFPVRVTVINAQGQYATWRATRATGDFDLRTFEVRAEPMSPINGLRPGMSVIAQWAGSGRGQ